MKLNFNKIFKNIRFNGFLGLFSRSKLSSLIDNEDYFDNLLSFLYLALIFSKLLEEKNDLIRLLKSKCDSFSFNQKNQLKEKDIESVHENYELLIDCLKHDLEQQKKSHFQEKENLQIEISNLEKNQFYLNKQLIDQLNLNSEYENIISSLNQKIESQLEQLELSQSNLNIIENELKSLEEQLKIANIQSLDQSKKVKANVMTQEKKLEDSLSTYVKLVEEKDILLNQATQEILELKNALYEQKKQFSETFKQYEEEIEQLRQENIYYKNLRDIDCPFEKKEETKREIDRLKHELQVAMVQLEGIRASSEIEELEEVVVIRQQLVQKIEEITILQDVIAHQKKEISELRSLLVEDFQESDDEQIDGTLDHLKKKLKEAVDEATLFCDETCLE